MDHAEFYRRYIEHCNERQWDELGAFVAENVQVNGVTEGLESYAAGLRDVVEAFPDFRWEVQELVVEADVLAARLTNSGTHRGTFEGVSATGRRVATTELAMYHLDSGKITKAWGDLGSTIRNELLSGEGFRAE
ncbi:ester cyclase [Kribbella sp. NPDC003505]|uniref:ester cyclase n=1 Tax=Kribbella sp. NPDC003505 TaxID=3154448 RepID=UPI0033A2404D